MTGDRLILKESVFGLFDATRRNGRLQYYVDIFLIMLIGLNVFAIMLESIESISSKYQTVFNVFEALSIAIFSIEYIMRIWTATAISKYSSPIAGRMRYMISPLALIDLAAILPFYLPLVVTIDLRFLRAIRLVRLLRVLKFGRYSESLRVFAAVLQSKRQDLFVTGLVVLVLLIISSSFIFLVENPAQPKAFSSIPAAMWWATVTLTTVGYGDVYPITTFGKILGGIIAILGIGLFALPAGILGSGFVEELQNRRSVPGKCPHCGKPLER